MKLLRARVTNFKCIEDSGWVWFDDVTCLVGKNESGKTAFLQALRRLSPAGGASGDFDLRDYPRRRFARYRPQHARRPADAVTAEFELLPGEGGAIGSSRVTVRKNYRNELAWEPAGIENHLTEFLPGLVYFDDYSLLPGRIALPEFRRRLAENRLDDSDRTFLALLRLAGVDVAALDGGLDYDTLKAELEAASAALTDEVLQYWSQNRRLRVEFDLAGDSLHLRIWNDRHRVSVPFDERSRGFVWFFSFLAYFSQLEAERADYIFLLDEPGLNLHAQAQKDFLRFIDERLAPQHPVIYTTHSPFLIDPARLDRIRTVEDVDGRGTVISADLTGRDPGTLLPIEAAVGWDRLRAATPISSFPHLAPIL